MSHATESIGKKLGSVGRTAFEVGTFGMSDFVPGMRGSIADRILPSTAPTQPNYPALTAPTAMPDPSADSIANVYARRTSIAAQLARRGRLSTFLSQPKMEPLGG